MEPPPPDGHRSRLQKALLLPAFFGDLARAGLRHLLPRFLLHREDARATLNDEDFVREARRAGGRPLSDMVEDLKAELACASMRDCEFPFPYIKRYLHHRGHHHL